MLCSPKGLHNPPITAHSIPGSNSPFTCTRHGLGLPSLPSCQVPAPPGALPPSCTREAPSYMLPRQPEGPPQPAVLKMWTKEPRSLRPLGGGGRVQGSSFCSPTSVIRLSFLFFSKDDPSLQAGCRSRHSEPTPFPRVNIKEICPKVKQCHSSH